MISTIADDIVIRRCAFREYHKLAHLHYCAARPATVCRTYGAYAPQRSRFDDNNTDTNTQIDSSAVRLVGIVVYSYPSLRCTQRDLATNNRYRNAHRNQQANRRLNTELVTLSRLVVDPQYRAIGLAGELIRRSIVELPFRYVECIARMGHYCPQVFTGAGFVQSKADENNTRSPAYFLFTNGSWRI